MPYLDGLPVATSVAGTDIIAVDQGGTSGIPGTATTRQTTVSAILQLGPGPITGPGSAVDGNVVTFNGTTGKVLADSGVAIARVVQGPVSSASGNIPAFSNTTGNGVSDSGFKVAAILSQIASVAALRAVTTASTPNSVVYVIGYRAGADGGEGAFWYNASDTTSSDNGGTIIVDASGRRWYREAGGQPFSILWFGGFNNGTTPNDAAFTAMVTVLLTQTGGASVVFPPGKYLFSTPKTINFPANVVFNFQISGPGAILYWPNGGGGLVANMVWAGQTMTVEGVHITTGHAAGGTGLLISQSSPLDAFFQSRVSDVVFRGDDNTGNGGNAYWTNCGMTSNACGTTWDTVTCYGATVSGSPVGNGIVFTGTGTTGIDYSIQHDVSKGIFNNLGIGITYGSFAQGLAVNQSLFANSATGLTVLAGESGALSQLQISDCCFNCILGQINILTSVGNVFIHDNDILPLAGTAGIQILSMQGVTISNNQISQIGPAGGTSYGVFLRGTIAGAPTVISGNTFVGTTYGVFLDTTATAVLVASNAAVNCTTPIQNNGTGNKIGTNLP